MVRAVIPGGQTSRLGGQLRKSHIRRMCSLFLAFSFAQFSLQFFIGRELNPTVGSLDIKSFNELRPGMILWQLILISMACEQATRRGGGLTDSMGLVIGFQSLYIADALYNEVIPMRLGAFRSRLTVVISF